MKQEDAVRTVSAKEEKAPSGAASPAQNHHATIDTSQQGRRTHGDLPIG